jgi:hypothetical protein
VNVLSSTQRPEGCLSDFAFDRRLAGELEAHEEEAARAHVDGCTRCTRRWEELSRELEAFANEPLPPRLRAHARGSRTRLVVAASAVLAAAAALVLFLRPPAIDGTRMKGGDVKLGFYVKHGESVRLAGPGERVGPGDALRFVYSSRAPQHLAILSVDGARHASIYFPSGATTTLVAAGTDVALPESTILDATLGDETIYGVFCPEPFAPEALRRELEAAPDRVPNPKGCVVETAHLTK